MRYTKLHFYEYKLHAVCGLFRYNMSFDLSKTLVHEIHYSKVLKQKLSNFTITGDKGYLSNDYQIDLFLSNDIKLEIQMTNNQINFEKQAYIFRKARKRI